MDIIRSLLNNFYAAGGSDVSIVNNAWVIFVNRVNDVIKRSSLLVVFGSITISFFLSSHAGRPYFNASPCQLLLLYTVVDYHVYRSVTRLSALLVVL